MSEGKIRTKIITIAPQELKLLEVNARYMRHETFQQLVTNIKRDGKLTQLPFAMLDEDGKYKVLSGNHRVKASMEAGLKEIEVIVTDDYLPHDRQMAIQLSHNAISGEDDPSILKELYESIDDIDMRMYAGLDDKTLELLEKVQPESLSEANLEFQQLTFVFLPDELEKVKEVFNEAKSFIASGTNEAWLSRWKEYDAFMESLEMTSASYNIKNATTALLAILNVFQRHIEELQDGYLDEEGEAIHNNWVPLQTLLGTDKIPAKSASIIHRALEKMMSEGDITNQNKWQAFEYLSADYLSGE